MKICQYCKNEIKDDVKICPHCGGVFEDPVPVPVRPKHRRRPLVICLSVLLAVVLIAGIVWFSLPTIAEKIVWHSWKEFVSEISVDPVISGVLTDVEKKLGENNYSLEIAMQTGSGSMTAEYDFSRTEKLLSGTVGYTSGKMDNVFRFSMDSREIQFSLDEDTYNVYGVRLRDIEKAVGKFGLSDTYLGEIVSNLDKNLFKKNNIQKELAAFLEESMTKLIQSVKVKKLNTQEMTFAGETQTCTFYQINWENSSHLLNADGHGIAAGLFRKYLQKIRPELVCIVNEDHQIRGLDFVFAGTNYRLNLEGKSNPWDKMYLECKNLSGEVTTYTGGISVTKSGLRIHMENDTEKLFNLIYVVPTGEFRLTGKNDVSVLQGSFRAEQGVTEFTITSEDGAVEAFSVRLKDLQEEPEELAESYRDILDMSLTDWQRLFFDLQ